MVIPVNIEDLLHKRKIESTRILKTGWNPDKIYRTICAFANDFDNIGVGYIIDISKATLERILKQLSSGPLGLVEYQGALKTGGYVLTEKGKSFVESMYD